MCPRQKSPKGFAREAMKQWATPTTALLLFLACCLIRANAGPQNVPGADWQRAKPEDVGYSTARLEALRAWLTNQTTTALLVTIQDKVIFEYGDIQRATKIASVRKSILSMLYGNYVVTGKIDLSQTVKQLGLQEATPFLPIEEHATLEHLLTARSGIYLPSGNDELDLQTPKRGSQMPGATFSYNNWDFNAAGTAFEKLTGKNIYDVLETDLARPLQFQDFDRARQKKIPAPGSVHPEFAMHLSTRDMARLGLLMLRSGKWGDKQIIDPNWCRHTTTIVTHFNDLNPVALKVAARPDRWGYGVLWWIWDSPTMPGGLSMGPLQGAFTAMGAGGQYITVLPVHEMVIVHKVDIDKDPNAQLTSMEYNAILSMLISSAKPK